MFPRKIDRTAPSLQHAAKSTSPLYTPIFSVITEKKDILEALRSIAARAKEPVWMCLDREVKLAIVQDVESLLTSPDTEIVDLATTVLADLAYRINQT